MKTLQSLVGLGVFLLTPLNMARSQSKTEWDALKAEVVELKKQVHVLKKDLASAIRLSAPPRRSNLEVRFEAASHLSLSSDQQAAYEILAIDAARQGDLKYTKMGIDKISNSTPRQNATYKASLLLAMAGLEKEGLELAKTLSESGIRNKALLKIAKGELDE